MLRETEVLDIGANDVVPVAAEGERASKQDHGAAGL